MAPTSRIELHFKAIICRFFQTIGRWCDLYLSTPLPQKPSFSISIPSTVGTVPGKFKLLFYAPPSYLEDFELPVKERPRYPVLINFHGGGYTIGNAADDARWATEVVRQTGAVVISVDYRLAPSYPFPTGIEDCVSAILYIWHNAAALSLDPSLTSLSGFSAGGNFTFTACYRLHSELLRLKAEDKLQHVEIGKIVSLAAFYPPTDWTKTREERAATNPNFTPMIPPIMSGLFEGAYLPPQPRNMTNPLLSPGLAADGLIKKALPENMTIITCWGDGLLHEAEVFREKLKNLGKIVEGYTVHGAVHGWDKWPSWFKGNPSRDEAYQAAAASLKKFWEEAAASETE